MTAADEERRDEPEAPTDPYDRAEMLAEVLAGLARPLKEISPKYFYDARGSALFERITTLEEYYPTRAERGLLEQCMHAWVEESRPASLVELGAGSASKSRIVLDAMETHATGQLYVPLDVSGDLLHETAARLREEYDGLQVEPRVADMTAALDLPRDLPAPTWYALLGGTLGNFDRPHAVGLLRRVARRMSDGDRFLLGVDRRPGRHKTRARLEAAYNDSLGVTAAFNLNVLCVLNRVLGCDFDPGGFHHRAFYDDAEGRVEMHLVSLRSQVVHFPAGSDVLLEQGESIRTEISCKYDRPTVEGLFGAAGLSVDRWSEDAEELFALVLGKATSV